MNEASTGSGSQSAPSAEDHPDPLTASISQIRPNAAVAHSGASALKGGRVRRLIPIQRIWRSSKLLREVDSRRRLKRSRVGAELRVGANEFGFPGIPAEGSFPAEDGCLDLVASKLQKWLVVWIPCWRYERDMQEAHAPSRITR